MPSGAHAAPGNGMIKAVFDANVLVSAFLSRDSHSTFSILTPRPCRKLFRACSMRRKKRGSFSS
jgi:hypothetical protein